jgi:electron transport complex protein RnfD
MMLSFTSSMTNYGTAAAKVDVLSSATPLAAMGELNFSHFMTLLLGQHGGVLGETCALALILGGVYLCVRKVIKPTIPCFYIGSVLVFTFLFSGFNGTQAVLSLFSGGLMLGAIFMATDYVTSPLTFKGQLIYALGCGFLTTMIRLFANSAEGVSFAILLMNLLVPYINNGSKTKPLGGVNA